MPAGKVLIGRDAACYYNTADLKLDGGATTAAVWLADVNTTEALNLMDANENVDSELVDSTTRAEARKGWAAELAVIKNGNVQFDMRWEPSDAFTNLLLANWDQQNAMTLAFFDRQLDEAGLAYTVATGPLPAIGETITGASSSATGVVTSVFGNLSSGTIYINQLSGSFQDGETIAWTTDTATLQKAATAQGIIANFSVSLTKAEALKDIQKATVTVTVATFPEWYVVP